MKSGSAGLVLVLANESCGFLRLHMSLSCSRQHMVRVIQSGEG